MIQLWACDEPGKGLERTVDDILRALGTARKHGVYSEAGLARKIRRESAVDVEVEQSGLPGEVCDYLFRAHVRELISTPGLTSRQRLALLLQAGGHSCGQAAETMGISRTSYCRVLERARARFERFRDPYAGWYEVYLSEVGRGKARSLGGRRGPWKASAPCRGL
jgi:hypothetical protein